MEQMSFSLICSKCNSIQPIEVQNVWGVYPPTIGLGPVTCCPALVFLRRDGAGEVCRGLLALTAGGNANGQSVHGSGSDNPGERHD